MLNLNVGIVKKAPAPTLERTRVREYDERASELQSVRSRLEWQLVADDELFASLQARAFRGEL